MFTYEAASPAHAPLDCLWAALKWVAPRVSSFRVELPGRKRSKHTDGRSATAAVTVDAAQSSSAMALGSPLSVQQSRQPSTQPSMRQSMHTPNGSAAAEAVPPAVSTAGTEVGWQPHGPFEPPPQHGMAEVAAFLEWAKLSAYIQVFEEMGYDDLPFLRQMGADQMAELASHCGMKLGHAQKLATYLAL